jgi:hypothetical protein
MIPMNPEQLLARLKSLTGELTRAQLASLAGAFVLVVGLVIGSAFWINRPSYALLFADMDPQAAAQVVERLTADNVRISSTPADDRSASTRRGWTSCVCCSRRRGSRPRAASASSCSIARSSARPSFSSR